MRYSASEMRNRWMEACHRHGEPMAARVARGRVCYRGLARNVKEMSPEKRVIVFADFFSDFPNGKRLSEIAAGVVNIDFANPSPLRDLLEPVGTHLRMLGLKQAIIGEVGMGGNRHSLDGEWEKLHRRFQLTERPLPGPLGRFLRELVDASLMDAPETEVGRAAVYVPRSMIIRLVWNLADGVETAWDHLGLVVLLGWIPIGLGDGGKFLVSRLPELKPVKIDG